MSQENKQAIPLGSIGCPLQPSSQEGSLATYQPDPRHTLGICSVIMLIFKPAVMEKLMLILAKIHTFMI